MCSLRFFGLFSGGGNFSLFAKLHGNSKTYSHYKNNFTEHNVTHINWIDI